MDKFDIGWELWRSFLAVMNERSLSGAARQLGVSQPTIGRHVDQLEATLGSSLFTRAQNGLTPTDLALALEPIAEGMAASAEALARTAAGGIDSEVGVVRLTASEIISIEVLPEILGPFHRAHPGIRIELDVSNKNADLLRRDADIAIRMRRPEQGALLARRLGDVRIGFYAHKSYFEHHSIPERPGDLSDHTIIGPDRDTLVLNGVTIAGRPVTPDMFTFRTDNDATQLAALRAGIGIGVCQTTIAARDPDLVPVLADEVRFDFEVWLSMHEGLRTNRRIKLVYDHLAEALGTYLKQN